MEMIIYKITCIGNGRIYIGQTTDFKQRVCYHKTYLKRRTHSNIYLQNSYNKYKINSFLFDIVEKCNSIEELNQKEIYWISFYRAAEKGFNIQLGGYSDRPSERGLENLRIAAMRLNKAVNQYSLKGEFLQQFLSLKAAAQTYKCRSSQIWMCCNKIIVQSSGFQYRYASENLQRLDNISNFKEINGKRLSQFNTNTKSKAIIQKTLDGVFVAEYPSIAKAVKINNFKNASMITNCLKKRQYCYSAYDYKWEYKS